MKTRASVWRKPAFSRLSRSLPSSFFSRSVYDQYDQSAYPSFFGNVEINILISGTAQSPKRLL